MLERILSGGQTGVDRGALDAALDAGFPCGGWCPRGRRAEDGPIPCRYPLSETSSPRYIVRTKRNVQDSDGTLVLAWGAPSGGTAATVDHAGRLGKPCLGRHDESRRRHGGGQGSRLDPRGRRGVAQRRRAARGGRSDACDRARRAIGSFWTRSLLDDQLERTAGTILSSDFNPLSTRKCSRGRSRPPSVLPGFLRIPRARLITLIRRGR